MLVCGGKEMPGLVEGIVLYLLYLLDQDICRRLVNILQLHVPGSNIQSYFPQSEEPTSATELAKSQMTLQNDWKPALDVAAPFPCTEQLGGNLAMVDRWGNGTAGLTLTT